HEDKNGLEDIRKAYHCIQLYLEHPHGHLRRLIARLIYWRNRKKFEQFYIQFPYFESLIIKNIVENYLDGGRFICPFLDLQALYAAHGGSVIDLMAMHGKEGK
ncbi:MAG: hypothetical protein SVC26_06135, partial [Pseudomonadota bacterium]|nr:hypothetical protein [Pseudomonadota bacterium]